MNIKHLPENKRRSAALALTILIIAAAVVIVISNVASSGSGHSKIIEGSPDYIDANMHRYLLDTLDYDYDNIYPSPFPDDVVHDESDESSSPIGINNHDNLAKYTSYTIQDAINEGVAYRVCFAVLVYHPKDDQFYLYFSKSHQMQSSMAKLRISMRYLTYMLRRVFPDRFSPSSPEFAMPVSSGDFPHLDINKLPYLDGKAPVLHFGSTLRQTDLFPNMVAMPMPSLHLQCFGEWVEFGTVCKDLSSESTSEPVNPVTANYPCTNKEVTQHDALDLAFEELIPQVIWRATDFNYLFILKNPRLQFPFNNPIYYEIKNRQEALTQTGETDQLSLKRATTEVLREHYDELLPRWKGTVLTAEAELDAVETGELPWANIRLSQYLENGEKTPTIDAPKYKMFQDADVAVGEFLSHDEQSQYRYQTDIAGGGGTSWTGTIAKLGMSGLLMHHITPMKDYFYDRLIPWKHFVPIKPDLSDLQEKVGWANMYPEEAEKIANRATEFVRYLGTPEGFDQIFQEDFVNVMKRVIDAYQPDGSWKQILESEDNKMVRLMDCPGVKTHWGACELRGEEPGGLYHTWMLAGNFPSTYDDNQR